jgi:hypothetical protein
MDREKEEYWQNNQQMWGLLYVPQQKVNLLLYPFLNQERPCIKHRVVV